MYIYGHGSCPAQYNNIYAMALGNKEEISQYFQDLGQYTVELGIYLLCPNKRVCIKEALLRLTVNTTQDTAAPFVKLETTEK